MEQNSNTISPSFNRRERLSKTPDYPKPILSKEELEKHGCIVFCRHFRPVYPAITVAGYKVKIADIAVPMMLTNYRRFKEFYELKTTGGFTEVVVQLPSGKCIMGRVVCSDKDTYNYRYGFLLALKSLDEEIKNYFD